MLFSLISPGTTAAIFCLLQLTLEECLVDRLDVVLADEHDGQGRECSSVNRLLFSSVTRLLLMFPVCLHCCSRCTPDWKSGVAGGTRTSQTSSDASIISKEKDFARGLLRSPTKHRLLQQPRSVSRLRALDCRLSVYLSVIPKACRPPGETSSGASSSPPSSSAVSRRLSM